MGKGKVIFNEDICKGCELCIEACPLDIIEMDKSRLNNKGYHPAVCIDEEKCSGCANCGLMCPDSVITVERE